MPYKDNAVKKAHHRNWRRDKKYREWQEEDQKNIATGKPRKPWKEPKAFPGIVDVSEIPHAPDTHCWSPLSAHMGQHHTFGAGACHHLQDPGDLDWDVSGNSQPGDGLVGARFASPPSAIRPFNPFGPPEPDVAPDPATTTSDATSTTTTTATTTTTTTTGASPTRNAFPILATSSMPGPPPGKPTPEQAMRTTRDLLRAIVGGESQVRDLSGAMAATATGTVEKRLVAVEAMVSCPAVCCHCCLVV